MFAEFRTRYECIAVREMKIRHALGLTGESGPSANASREPGRPVLLPYGMERGG